MSNQLLKAQGCLMGLISGDNLGALVEFYTHQEVKKAYKHGFKDLEDGGFWGLKMGQPTDDGELAITLARSIIKEKGFHQAKVLKAYRKWANSNPFDMGNTTRSALVFDTISPTSISNGSLMRIAPLGIYGTNLLNLEKVDQLARQDASCTHQTEIVLEVTSLYARAITLAIKNEKITADELYENIRSWARNTDVIQVINDAKLSMPKYMDVGNTGSCLIAFQCALYQILHTKKIQDALNEIIKCGGDTDTNAAIAGALFGALYGLNEIPNQWKAAVLSCESVSPDTEHPRPKIYWPTDILTLAQELIQIPTI